MSKKEKGPVEFKAEKTSGRPSMYRKEYDELGRKFCLLGATDVELADLFEVSRVTLANWKSDHESFAAALLEGKDRADANVAYKLYQRAMGYEHPEVDIKVIAGEIVKTPITKIYAPDPAACIFWLKNRQKAKWRDKIDHQHTGPDGGPIDHSITVSFVKPS